MTVNSAVTDTQWCDNFDPGRPYGDPLGIVIHHWGGRWPVSRGRR